MSGKTDNPAEVGLHLFERAGLGKAPFRVVGFAELKFKAFADAPTQCGGSCDYCGTGIIDAFYIQGSDGRKFKVGSNCVEKTGDAGLIRQYKNSPEFRKAKRAKAATKDEAIKAEWASLISAPATVAALGAVTVPGRPWIAGDVRPLLESLANIWAMCGASGRARTLKTLKGHLKAARTPEEKS